MSNKKFDESAKGTAGKTVPEDNRKDAPETAESAQEKAADTAGSAPEQSEEVKELLQKVQKASSDLEEIYDKYLRLAAEYDNYRKRAQKERENLYRDVRADTIQQFLPVYDNLERALKFTANDEAIYKGVELTMSQLTDILAKLGVTEIPALGNKFDPNLHNAVMHAEDKASEPGTVIEVLQKGFMIGEKVIRFAMVKVAG